MEPTPTFPSVEMNSEEVAVMVFVLLKYGNWPVAPEKSVVVAIQAIAVPFHPRWLPYEPVLSAPYSVEVATNDGTAAPAVLLARTLLAVAVEPKDVALLPELVTAPERFALVVTVAALPPMENDAEEVAICAKPVPAELVYKS